MCNNTIKSQDHPLSGWLARPYKGLIPVSACRRSENTAFTPLLQETAKAVKSFLFFIFTTIKFSYYLKKIT